MKKGINITNKILEILAEGAVTSLALLGAFLESGYGVSYHKLNMNFEKNHDFLSGSGGEFSRERRNFKSMLSKLKQAGLIEEGKSGWIATALGKKKISTSMPSLSYEKEGDKTLKIVIFDVPEKYRRKRDWLRRALTEIGFKKLQQSVWSGKIRLPREFMDDLKDLDLLDYVDILEVTKTGSVREL
ncbi:MAG: hypothetical protein A3B23_00775 [Candidatus Colwellbacteria bacterium RIFCSPLOWO2_01_FULL_48_10]|uniref:Transcriptional repressor PaaX-like central Cas2-like domain-containing protein n=2 Tax=Bacteria candidate phyla TaxID=1783234 RepID=A0A1F5NZ21_9BACT|nr:MAG: hypothetical protein A2846_03415 [Candidatus Doudnabacteria bacterium RIFCSPHIGHO2_01_FULL_49_9]OGY59717.1 MAG: hypothetical protein A3B23_00775 [Candidatus Colwellbacteria bacterium RIFCSPLOWO2_01_FULL_48_10]